MIEKEYRKNGYYVARQLFTAEEAARYRNHFMKLRASGSFPGDMSGVDSTSDDPLAKFPRMIHMHRWDRLSLDWALEPRIADLLRLFLGQEPLAVQTMLYFKPAGSRGQALHQDQHFIRVDPGETIAVWMALDHCDEENGCLQVIPETHQLPILCTEKADTTKSFTDVGLGLPDELRPIPVNMRPGDVLFFHGHLIHGSFPNTSQDRFRRALIAHYISADAVKVADYYHPVVAMTGEDVTLADSPGGGPCGVWVDVDGVPVVEVV